MVERSETTPLIWVHFCESFKKLGKSAEFWIFPQFFWTAKKVHLQRSNMIHSWVGDERCGTALSVQKFLVLIPPLDHSVRTLIKTYGVDVHDYWKIDVLTDFLRNSTLHFNFQVLYILRFFQFFFALFHCFHFTVLTQPYLSALFPIWCSEFRRCNAEKLFEWECFINQARTLTFL